MFRAVTLAAVAALLAAAPASAKSIEVSTAGKSTAEIKAEVVKAAVDVCRAEVGNSALAFYLQTPCVRSTIESALQKADIKAQLAAR
jgi:hypothetical protein